MGESQYAKYIRKDIQIKVTSHPHPEVTSPVLWLNSDESFGNANLRLVWMPITEPFAMEIKTHSHDFDQFLAFLGGDLTNAMDLGGEVEITLGEEGKELEAVVITTATIVHIPKGLLHCPLVFKKINDPKKPILFQELSLTPKYDRSAEQGDSTELSEYEIFMKNKKS